MEKKLCNRNEKKFAALNEFGNLSHKFNYMDTLILVHSFRDLKFHDNFFQDQEF